MSIHINRRKFIEQSAAGIALGGIGAAAGFWPGILSAEPIRKQTFNIGCAAITWGNNLEAALDEISELGFKGIQLRGNAYDLWKEKPEKLWKEMKSRNLTCPVFSAGEANFNTSDDDKLLDELLEKAEFFARIGAQFAQLTNGMRPKNEAELTPELIKKFSHRLNEIAEEFTRLGLTVVYHNHMGQLGQKPEETDAILSQTDPTNVAFLLDIAHYWQGGGDPVRCLKRYENRIPIIHLKDVRQDAEDPTKYKFVELGQGQLPVQDFMTAMEQTKFRGWGMVELDSPTSKDKTAKQCTEISRQFIIDQGFRL
ncbi:MAG: TIM barrel protein [Bacteroidota bacterium]